MILTIDVPKTYLIKINKYLKKIQERKRMENLKKKIRNKSFKIIFCVSKLIQFLEVFNAVSSTYKICRHYI